MKRDEIGHLLGFIGGAAEQAVDARGLEIAAGCFMAAEDIYQNKLSAELHQKTKEAWSKLCAFNRVWAREISFELLQAEGYADGDVEPTEE